MKTNCRMCLHYYRIIATQQGYNPYPCCHLIEDTGESPHPLASKLRRAIHCLRDIDIKEQTRSAGHWFIQNFDTSGKPIPAIKLTTEELDHIGNLVRAGFASGEIAENAVNGE